MQPIPPLSLIATTAMLSSKNCGLLKSFLIAQKRAKPSFFALFLYYKVTITHLQPLSFQFYPILKRLHNFYRQACKFLCHFARTWPAFCPFKYEKLYYTYAAYRLISCSSVPSPLSGCLPLNICTRYSFGDMPVCRVKSLEKCCGFS